MSKFEIYQGSDKLWYGRLKANNGRIVLDLSEGYASKGNVRKAVKRVKELVAEATYSIWDEE